MERSYLITRLPNEDVVLFCCVVNYLRDLVAIKVRLAPHTDAAYIRRYASAPAAPAPTPRAGARLEDDAPARPSFRQQLRLVKALEARGYDRHEAWSMVGFIPDTGLWLEKDGALLTGPAIEPDWTVQALHFRLAEKILEEGN